MDKKFKYIIWDLPMEGEVPVIFPSFLNHSDFLPVHDRKFIVAAGEGKVSIEEGKIKVFAWGHSYSLSTSEKRIVAREQDSKILLCSFVGEDYR